MPSFTLSVIRITLFVLFALVGTGCSGLELTRAFRTSPDDWTLDGGGPERQQRGPEFPELPWKRAWVYNAQGGMLATPLVRDSIAILGTLHGELQAVELRTGKRLGYEKVGGPVRGTPALNGTVVYVPISTETRPSVLAVDVKGGRRVWQMTIGPVEAPLLLYESRLYAATLEGRIVCLDAATGEEQWRFQIGTKAERKPIRSSPALVGSMLVVGSDAGLVVGLDAATGAQRWSMRMSAALFAGVTAGGGSAVIGDILGRVTALDPESGAVRWTRELESPIYAAGATDGSTCYIPTADGRIEAMDLATGAPRWTFRANSVINASPLIVGNRLLVGSLDRSVWILDRNDGSSMERIEVDGRVKVPPVVWRGIVLVTYEDKSVAAFVHEGAQ